MKRLFKKWHTSISLTKILVTTLAYLVVYTPVHTTAVTLWSMFMFCRLPAMEILMQMNRKKNLVKLGRKIKNHLTRKIPRKQGKIKKIMTKLNERRV